MSSERWVIIRCDLEKCRERFSYDTHIIGVARNKAKAADWAYGRRKDYCPRHREYAGGAS